MVHIKWLAALVLTAALSAFIAYRLTHEDMLARMAEEMATVDDWHAQLIKEMEEEKHLSVKTKLGWLRGLQAKEMEVLRQELEGGYFSHRNADAIEKLQRRPAPPSK
jgi:hypothetical protein